MESWLPWLTEEEHLLPDLLPAGARVLLVEPRRMRDRAQELLDEEANLAETLAGHVGRRRSRLPAPLAAVRAAARAHQGRATSLPRLTGLAGHPAARGGGVRSGGRRRRGARRSDPRAARRRTRVVIATEGRFGVGLA